MSDIENIIKYLKDHGSVENRLGMAHYGINVQSAFGVKIPLLRVIAKEYKKKHALALELWASGFHEARVLAGMIDDPMLVTDVQVEKWVADFNSWDLCDQCCMNLFRYLPFAAEKAIELSRRDEEFVKRAGFALMASLASGSKNRPDKYYTPFFDCIIEQSGDDRKMVKKAVNWALRQIGKRNSALCAKAIEISHQLIDTGNKTAIWIAKDAIKELEAKKF
ncbi:MAG: DNA alkylation repair protein [Bacteroidota bacterium]